MPGSEPVERRPGAFRPERTPFALLQTVVFVLVGCAFVAFLGLFTDIQTAFLAWVAVVLAVVAGQWALRRFWRRRR